MIKYIHILLITLLLSSCSSTFFLSSLSSHDPNIEQVENGDFLLEERDFWIAHSFNGENAPVRITVFNKSDKPLYIDWNKSAMTINGEAHSFARAEVETYFNEFGEAKVIIESTKVPNNISFVPPNSMISHVPMSLAGVTMENIPNKEYRSAKMSSKGDQVHKVKRIDFDGLSTPLKLQSYLTVYFEGETPRAIEEDFYLRSVVKTKSISPKNLPGDLSQRGDLFFIEKQANNTGWEILAGAGIIVGVIALDVITSDYD